MRIKTTCRPIAGEYSSMVDLVRRDDPPPYARSSRWVNWIEPGGIVWVFVWLRIALFLVIFGLIAGVAYGPVRGIRYSLPAHKLRQVDLSRVLAGQPVLDRTGVPVIDPADANISVYSVIDGGQPRLRFQSGQIRPGDTVILILLTDRTATYGDLVTAMDRLRLTEQDATIWLAPTALSDVQSN